MSDFVNFALSPSLCYSLKTRNYGMREKKIICIYDCFSGCMYQCMTQTYVSTSHIGKVVEL